MNRINQKIAHSCIRICNPHYLEGESSVQSHLSYTPADMQRMVANGHAISPAALNPESVSETDFKKDWDFSCDSHELRGCDINSVWESMMDSKQKIKKARKDGAFKPVEQEKGV